MDFLDRLNIKADNKGVSTGTKWIAASREKINSQSPVDGKQIATVSMCDRKTYNAIVDAAQKAFGRSGRRASPREWC